MFLHTCFCTHVVQAEDFYSPLRIRIRDFVTTGTFVSFFRAKRDPIPGRFSFLSVQ